MAGSMLRVKVMKVVVVIMMVTVTLPCLPAGPPFFILVLGCITRLILTQTEDQQSM